MNQTGNDPEIIWSRAISQSSNWESDNFPPSLLGNGRVNPSQNLVNAFPMKNGYPITNALSLYQTSNPYANRDPRLARYIVFNGNKIGAKPATSTIVGAPLDGINMQTNSTRTGYYLSKFMNDGVVLGPAIIARQHFHTYFRFTDIYLAYAEAAFEAYGPDADPNNFGFTARNVLQKIRQRAGITQPDAYLASANGDVFKTLIRNERRLELCFEGERFFDVRRWKDLNAFKASIMGAFITVSGSTTTYEYKSVETRPYEDHMIYGPIPINEILKSSALEQNDNWIN